jgi:hypothetical protein
LGVIKIVSNFVPFLRKKIMNNTPENALSFLFISSIEFFNKRK